MCHKQRSKAAVWCTGVWIRLHQWAALKLCGIMVIPNIMRVHSVSLQLYDQMEAMSQSGLRDPEASATDRTVYPVLLAELRARVTRMVSDGCGLFCSPALMCRLAPRLQQGFSGGTPSCGSEARACVP